MPVAVEELQHAVGTTVDGQWGPKSRAALWSALQAHNAPVYAALIAYVASRPTSPDLSALGIAMSTHLPAYGMIDNTGRLSNFLGQGSHETMGFRYLHEIWGPTAAQRGYEG